MRQDVRRGSANRPAIAGSNAPPARRRTTRCGVLGSRRADAGVGVPGHVTIRMAAGSLAPERPAAPLPSQRSVAWANRVDDRGREAEPVG